MAITTDSYYDIIKDGVTLDRIGLSKTLDNYTIEEIADYAFVGSYSQFGKQIMPKSLPGWTYVGYSQEHGSCPFAASFHSGTYERIDMEDGLTEDYNLTENGIYRKVVLLHDTTGTYPFNLTTASLANMKIITEFDAPKYTMDFGTKNDMKAFGSDYWQPYESSSAYNTHIGHTDNAQVATCGFMAYIVIEYNSTYYIIMANMINKILASALFEAYSVNDSSRSKCAYQIVDYQNSNDAGIAESVLSWWDNADFTGDNPTPIVQNLSTAKNYWNNYDGYCSLIEFTGTPNKGFKQHFAFTEEYNLLLFIAGCYGIHFIVDGTVYKPIISDNFVTGYTDDLNVASDLDGYTGSTKHDLPVTPPGPTPPGPSGDDPWDGVDFGGTGAGGGGAFCSVYYMTGAQLTSLKNWSNTSAPEGFDMLPSIIGLQQLPVAVTGAPTTVKFLKSGAITSQGESRVIDTQVPAGTGTGQPISFSLGSIDISRRMQQRGEPYLDYDCTVELFLPFAGTFVLDTQAVMGRTISAEIVIDPVNGTAFAYAWVSQNGQKMPIAYGSSSIAVDLPIASNQWGISRAAFKQISHQMTMNAIKDIGNFMIGLGTFKTGQSGAIADRSGFASLSIQEGLQAKQIGGQMMTSSTINAATDTASAIVNAHQLNNTNYTAVNGSFGGSYAEWSQPFTAYVRITRPKFKKPSNFNHTQAVPCVETKKLSACVGLTICINPDCGAIPCTEAEKIMITQALVGGVYAGGGGQ